MFYVQAHQFLAQINLLILGMIMSEEFIGLKHATIIYGQLSVTNLVLFCLGKYIHLRVVHFH